MKIKYHCSGNYGNLALCRILEEEKIECKKVTDNCFVFDFYSDHPKHGEILKYASLIINGSNPIIHKTPIFSKKEMQDANWYAFWVNRMALGTNKEEFTYKASCCYTYCGVELAHHREQVNPFVSKKTPKWKNKFNFCSTDTGDFHIIFCSDYAKETIIKNEIRGVEFLPVLKNDLITHTENVHQLFFPYILPKEALILVGKYKEKICPTCGKFDYAFEDLDMPNLKLKSNLIPAGIDAFRSEITIGSVASHRENIISKKFYQVLTEELNEKHIVCYPMA